MTAELRAERAPAGVAARVLESVQELSGTLSESLFQASPVSEFRTELLAAWAKAGIPETL